MGKYWTVETGITKENGLESYRIKTKDPVTGVKNTVCFYTLKAARAGLKKEKARVAERKRVRDARTPEEKRAANLETYGGNCALERDALIKFKRFYPLFHISNDSTVQDSLYGPDVKKLPWQLKTAGGHVMGRPNQWRFAGVRGYADMPVVLWRVDKGDGWVFHGRDLDELEIKSDSIGVTPGGKYTEMAISGPEPLDAAGLVAFFDTLLTVFAAMLMTIEEGSWNFKSINYFKERVGMAQYMEHYDKGATFPAEQNGSYDLFGSDLAKLQLKTATAREGQYGLYVHLYESAGRVDSKQTGRAYKVGSFEFLIVYWFDWDTNLAHCWIIPESDLIEHNLLKTETCEGKTSFYVYMSEEQQGECGLPADTWAAKFYKGTKPIVLSETAERIGKKFLVELRGEDSEASSSTEQLPEPVVDYKRLCCYDSDSEDEE